MPLTKSPRHHFAPACSPDGKIRFLSGPDMYTPGPAWTFDRKTGQERQVAETAKAARRPNQPPVAKCDAAAVRAPGGKRFACPSGQAMLIYDAAAKKELARAQFRERPTPPSAIAWSPDGNWLLVGTQGKDDNSTSRQSDFFVLNLKRTAWISAGSGNDPMWLPGSNKILYSTPRDLVPLTESSKHQEWSSQLVVFDPATERSTTVTSGVSYNIQPAPCPSRR
jgi:hypothetical protein